MAVTEKLQNVAQSGGREVEQVRIIRAFMRRPLFMMRPAAFVRPLSSASE